ncbi:MAG: AEC family transporter [Treponema sp.]
MTMFANIFSMLLVMMVIALAGFIFAKICKVSEREEKFLSKLLLYFINPCLIFNSFNVEFDRTQFYGLLLSAGLSFLVTFAMIFIAEIVFHRKTPVAQIQKIGTVFTNCGFIGIPLITAVYGSSGVFYLMGYIVAFNVMLWIYGYYQVAQTINLKKIITNPNIIAVLAGVILFVSPVKLPEIISYPVSLIGGLNTATAMILLGILFGNLKKEWIEKLLKTVRSFFTRDKSCASGRKKIGAILFTTFVRLVLCGLCSLGICVLVIMAVKKFFPGFDYDALVLICSVVLIASLCPSGISVSSLACLFDKDTVFSNFLVCFTHTMSVFTIPAIFALFQGLFF